VRQLGADLLLARACLARDDEVGRDEADPGRRDRQEEHAAGTGDGAAEQGSEREPADRERRLEREERRRRDLAAQAGGEQSGADPGGGRLGMQLQREAGEPVAQRRQHALLERQLPLAERGADLAVGGGAADGGAPLAGGQGDGLADEVRSSGETENS